MIHVRTLRSYTPRGETKEITHDKPYEPIISFETVRDLFKNLNEVIEKINEKDRWNCYYTLANGTPGKNREFLSQSVIAFDIDHVDLTKDSSGKFIHLDTYVSIICTALQIDKSKTAIIISGNGLQVIISLNYSVTTKEYFKQHKKLYDLICTRLTSSLRAAGLKGEADRVIFEPMRLMRLPGTLNKKAGRPDKMAELVCGNLEPQDFDLNIAAGGDKPLERPKEKLEESSTSQKSKPEKRDDIEPKSLKKLKIDSVAVESGCTFLQWCRKNQTEVTEPQWHAMISVVSRLSNGPLKVHEYSKDYAGYSKDQTQQKIDFSLNSGAGPRTCENINSLWQNCSACPNYNKVASPLLLQGEDFIGSKDNGFHTLNSKGKMEPDYEGLRRQFYKEHRYKIRTESAAVYTYDGKKYNYFYQNELRAYAGEKFWPIPKEFVVKEWMNQVSRRNLSGAGFFDPRGKINFQNGCLDSKSGVLRPHSEDDGFLYVLPFEYSAGAKCPEFDAMMKRITCDDADLEKLLIEFTGYAICDTEYWIQKALVLVGDGANGKSTFLDIVKALVGQGNFSVLSVGQLNDETARSQLEGKIINISEEMPNYNIRNTETFKKIMGSEVSIRKLYENAVVIRNRAKFLFACNEVPGSFDHSHGMHRRMILVPFEQTFKESEYDHDLVRRLMLELPGIFNRFYAGWRDLKARGKLPDCQRVNEELEIYKDELDSIGQWVKDNLQYTETVDEAAPFTLKNDLYSEYRNHCLKVGEKPLSMRLFTGSLKRHIPKFKTRVRQKRFEGKRERVIMGVKMTHSPISQNDAF